MVAASRRDSYIVIFWWFERFAHSARHLRKELEEFRGLGIDFVSQQEAVDTSTHDGSGIFMVIAAMAELEASSVRDRVIVGVEGRS